MNGHVIEFAKLRIVHTSNFQLWQLIKVGMTDKCETCKDCRTTILVLLLKVQICMPFPVVVMDLQMPKIRSVNYAYFPKSSHIFAQENIEVNN